jgi:hypothetical protein
MAAGTTPIFITTPKGEIVNFATANTARDGSGTIATLYTAGANGARIDKITVQATVTTTAGVIRLFRKVSAGTFRLYREIVVTAVPPSTTVEAWSYILTEPIILSANDVLGISTNNAEAFNGFADGGDY